jgi:hypothetical protein
MPEIEDDEISDLVEWPDHLSLHFTSLNRPRVVITRSLKMHSRGEP